MGVETHEKLIKGPRGAFSVFHGKYGSPRKQQRSNHVAKLPFWGRLALKSAQHREGQRIMVHKKNTVSGVVV